MSNAFNLIDGLDGLAAGLALVSTLGLLAAAAVSGRWETVLVAAALAGALLGFLPYNFNPARVFLGDCGALPVGFILAAIAVKSSIKASAAIAVAVPLLALALPILDVGLAVVRRVVRRRPVFEGGSRPHPPSAGGPGADAAAGGDHALRGGGAVHVARARDRDGAAARDLGGGGGRRAARDLVGGAGARATGR